MGRAYCFWEEGSFQEDVEFDPEPLGFVEKGSEEGFMVRRTAEVKVGSDREGEGSKLSVSRRV